MKIALVSALLAVVAALSSAPPALADEGDVTWTVRTASNSYGNDRSSYSYSVNPGGGSYQLNKISLFGQENMERFAVDTGGTAYAPKFQSVDNKVNYDNATNTRLNNEMLDRIFRQLGSELRSQYLVQYYSEPDYANGKFVKLDLTVPTHPGVKVRARQGYYVKN